MYQHTKLGELAVMIFRLNTSLLTWGDTFSAQWGLTSTRWRILGALARSETQLLTAPQIAQAMGLTRQGVQKQLNDLCQQRLIKTQANPEHKRSCFYQLTPPKVTICLKKLIWLLHKSPRHGEPH